MTPEDNSPHPRLVDLRAAESDALAASRFSLRGGAILEVLPDCVLLFTVEQQQLHRFNDSSAVLAQRLSSGATIAELESELAAHGVDAASAERWVKDFLKQLAGQALLGADYPFASSPAELRTHIAMAGADLAVEYDSDALMQSVGQPLAHLNQSNGVPQATYRLAAAGDFVFIARDGEHSAVIERLLAAVSFKGMILEHILNGAHHVCALHAACLIGDGGAMLLLGAPGAGKTTLTMALLKEGFRYASDDVTLVLPGGNVRGVPLAPGVKESAWEMVCGLAELPIHLRPDGQKVKFAQIGTGGEADACPVRTIVNLRREADQTAELRPVTASGALVELFRESRSADGTCSNESIHALAAIVRGAASFDLHYGHAADAAALLARQARNG